MVKVRVTCNKNIIERFGVKKPEGWDFQYINYPCSDEELVTQCILKLYVRYIQNKIV